MDESYLSASDTVYPVYVDPTITVNMAQIKDATLYSGKPTRQAGLIETYLYAGNDNAGGCGTERFLIGSPYLVGAIQGAGVTSSMITQVKLRMYNASTASSSAYISVYMFNSNWAEGTVSYSSVNWNNYYNYQDYANVTNYSGYYWWDITSATKSWLAGNDLNNYGLLVKSDDEYIANKEHKFCASDSTNNSVRPFMEVTYWESPGLPTSVIKRDGSYWCWNASAEMIARSLYPYVGTKNQSQAFNYVKNRPLNQAITDNDKNTGGEAADVNKAIKYFTNDTVACQWIGAFEAAAPYRPWYNTANPSAGRATASQLQSEFAHGRPVIIYIRPNTNTGEGHLVVLAGYNNSTGLYTVLDPNNTSNPASTGKIRQATYAQLTSNIRIKDNQGENIGGEPNDVWVVTMFAYLK